MPTSDPIRRRKQNCENQKRWRERQSTQIRHLVAAIEVKDQRIAKLEADVENQSTALRSAIAEVDRLRREQRGLKTQTRAFLNQLESALPNESNPEELADPVHADVLADEKGSSEALIETIPILWPDESREDGGNECSPNLRNNLRNTTEEQVAACVDIHNNQTYKETLADIETDPDDGGEPSDPISTTVVDQMCYPEVSLAEFSDGFPLEEQDEAPPPMESFYVDCSIDWMIGGTTGLARNVSTFPDLTRISKHISAVQNVLSNVLDQLTLKPYPMRDRALAEAFSWMIRESWPSSERCLKMMTVYQHIFSYEVWRNFPCKTTYYRLHPLYRPTMLQLIVPHSPAIDWLPWPSLRDKVIQMQNRVDVDHLCMVSLDHTVIEPSYPRNELTNATFRIWDMYLLEKSEGGYFAQETMTHSPVSQSLWALAHAYGLPFQDITHLRIDREFYEQFPEMLLPECISTLRTTPLNVQRTEHLEYPCELKPASVLQLQSLLQGIVA